MSSKKSGGDDTVLVTGFPSFTAKRMILKLLEAKATKRVFILVQHNQSAEATEFGTTLPSEQRRKLNVFVGDVTNMDLGLSGKEYQRLVSELTHIHHMAARFYLGVTKDLVQQVNVGGTRGTLELALECEKLKRYCFWSTVHVSGERDGVIMEDELYVGQRFRNPYEHSKYAAEKIVRSMSRRVPSSIFRPGIIVGDSRTGEIGRFDGPYHLMLVLMGGPFDLQFPLPGRGVGPLHIVPVDYVIDAAYALSRMPETVSKTFHIVDPCPLSAKSIYELVADRAHLSIPKSVIPQSVAKAVLKIPWAGKLMGSPRTLMEGFNQQVYYNCRNTLDALRHTDIWCPPFERYADNLLQFAKVMQVAHRRSDEEAVDPLD
ncbi:MAG: SDR family oxidoreductase [Pseudomonadota bacterium]